MWLVQWMMVIYHRRCRRRRRWRRWAGNSRRARIGKVGEWGIGRLFVRAFQAEASKYKSWTCCCCDELGRLRRKKKKLAKVKKRIHYGCMGECGTEGDNRRVVTFFSDAFANCCGENGGT